MMPCTQVPCSSARSMTGPCTAGSRGCTARAPIPRARNDSSWLTFLAGSLPEMADANSTSRSLAAASIPLASARKNSASEVLTHAKRRGRPVARPPGAVASNGASGGDGTPAVVAAPRPSPVCVADPQATSSGPATSVDTP